jgi:hypothetical protein
MDTKGFFHVAAYLCSTCACSAVDAYPTNRKPRPDKRDCQQTPEKKREIEEKRPSRE